MNQTFTLQKIKWHHLLLTLLIACSLNSTAQTWQPWGPNDFDKLSYKNVNYPSVALLNGTPYVAFDEEGLYVKKLRADGSGWDLVGAAKFSGPVGGGSFIKLRFNGTTPYVAYKHSGTSNRGIVRMFNGTSWDMVGGSPFSTTAADGICFEFAQDNTPYVAFKESNLLTVKKFNGTAWENVGTPGFGNGSEISLALSGNVPYVSFRDGNASFGATVMKFNGTAWETVGNAGFSLPSFGSGQVQYTSLSFDGTTPYIAYISSQFSDKVCVQKFNGTAWESVGSQGFSSGTASFVSMIINGGVPYVAYKDHASANGQRATLKKFDGTGWITVGTEGFSTAGANDLSIAFDGNTPYVTYGSGHSSSSYNEAVVMRLNTTGNTWERVGMVTSLYTTDVLARFVFNGTTPYIYYRNEDNKAAVKKFNGQLWESVGAEGFTQGEINNHFVLTFDNTTTPYISYVNNTTGVLWVMKYNGTNWEDVGSSIATNVTPLSLHFDNTNTACIVYRQSSSGNNSVVMKKYNGSSWQTMQSASFASGSVTNFNITYDNGAPSYIIYADPSQSSKATVKQYNGSAWVNVGVAGFTPAAIQDVFIRSINGTPYVVFKDAGVSWNLSVMKFNSNAWEFVGSRGFSNGDESNPELIYDNNTLYVAYKDRVEQFDGNDWIDLGDNTRPSYSFGYHLLFRGNTPYVAYSDGPAAKKATVKKFTGTGASWSVVGNSAFTSSETSNLTMAFDGDDVLVVYRSYRGGVFAKKISHPDVLPVQLLSYTAKAIEDRAVLDWSTATEINNKMFIISRSINGVEFNEIGRIAGAHNSTSVNYYQYYDQFPLPGKNYYKLEQVDLDGRKQMLGIRTVRFDKHTAVRIYPNPTKGNITVSFTPALYRSITVTNMAGKILHRLTVDPNATMATIKLDNFSAGFYMITLSGSDETKTIKMVKN